MNVIPSFEGNARIGSEERPAGRIYTRGVSMRVGSLVYATDSGLGILAKSFYDAGVVTDVAVIRHGHHITHDDWYPNALQVSNLRDPAQLQQIVRFCKSMDVMLFFETPFYWQIINHCRDKDVKTVLMPMYECMPEKLPAQPDMFICPSLLDLQYYPSFGGPIDKGVDGQWSVYIPVPVEVPWRQRTRAEVFVHNAGHGGLKGRNGTSELLQAFRLTKSPAKLLLRSQRHQDWPPYPELLDKVALVTGTVGYDILHWEGDVFIFPEKFNGLSLPLQEARAAGMLVMCGDRFPMNTWLPKDVDYVTKFGGVMQDSPLIPVAGYHKERVGPPYTEYDCAEFDPRDIATKIDEWCGRNITGYSLSGKQWAEENSWTKLKPRYMDVLKCLVNSTK